MSEKLGTEQGRETAMNKNNYCSYQTATHYCGKQGGHIGEHYLYLKLIAGHQANCINFRDGAMCDCGALEPQAEQAYHARGAGLQPVEDWYVQHDGTVIFERMIVRKTPTVSSVEHSEPERLYFILREPGADTGTTPQGGGRSPNDTSPMYSDDVIAAIRQQKQSTAAERGTTPPEGLRAALEQVLSEGHCNDTCSSQLVETCTCDCWKAKVHAALAATQRAPVEQGRDELQELKLSSEGERSGSSHPVTIGSSPSPASADHARGTGREPRDAQDYVERFFGPAVEFIQQNGYADWDGSANGQTITLTGCANMIAHWKRGELAPDHAREGATIKCPKCGIDVFAHGETCPVSREGALLKLGAKLDKIISQAALDAKLDLWMRQQVNAALDGLADGKEGGE